MYYTKQCAVMISTVPMWGRDVSVKGAGRWMIGMDGDGRLAGGEDELCDCYACLRGCGDRRVL